MIFLGAMGWGGRDIQGDCRRGPRGEVHIVPINTVPIVPIYSPYNPYNPYN